MRPSAAPFVHGGQMSSSTDHDVSTLREWIMNRLVLLLALGCAALTTGCAAVMDPNAATWDDEKVYLTGTRIPVKDKAARDKKTDRSEIDNMEYRSRVIPVPTSN